MVLQKYAFKRIRCMRTGKIKERNMRMKISRVRQCLMQNGRCFWCGGSLSKTTKIYSKALNARYLQRLMLPPGDIQKRLGLSIDYFLRRPGYSALMPRVSQFLSCFLPFFVRLVSFICFFYPVIFRPFSRKSIAIDRNKLFIRRI